MVSRTRIKERESSKLHIINQKKDEDNEVLRLVSTNNTFYDFEYTKDIADSLEKAKEIAHAFNHYWEKEFEHPHEQYEIYKIVKFNLNELNFKCKILYEEIYICK